MPPRHRSAASSTVLRRMRHRRGVHAEWIAALWLLLKGYRLRAWRCKTPVGEIDLIATRGSILVFVEVKARRTSAEAAEAITPHNQARILGAAAYFLRGNPQFSHFQPRFDAVFICPRALPLHRPHAFATQG